MDADRLAGYEHEVRTPGAVAAAVSNGFADAGVCPAAMAREAGLRFTPLGYETCDLLIREELAGMRPSHASSRPPGRRSSRSISSR
ncbi:substrate-binding domain-containing protein [Methanoculleus bourgensis]|uniref:substrate-binding domain-containing protein n=1 Tax=Methanoculleus bourgensis TaxID=83986 RepID=UPI00307C1315